MSESREYVIKALEYLDSLGITADIEKAPYCFLPDYVDRFLYEESILDHHGVYDENVCDKCVLRIRCPGVDPDYVSLFGFDGIEQIVKLKPSQASYFDYPELGKYEPSPYRLNVVCWDIFHETDPDVLRTLIALRHRAQNKLGELICLPEWILNG